MSEPLRPCDGCARHVLASSRECPFCACALEAQHDGAWATPRVGRAALVALGIAAVASGCDAPWVAVAHADTLEEPVSLAPQYGAPPEWYDPARRARDAGAPTSDVPAPPRAPR